MEMSKGGRTISTGASGTSGTSLFVHELVGLRHLYASRAHEALNNHPVALRDLRFSKQILQSVYVVIDARPCLLIDSIMPVVKFAGSFLNDRLALIVLSRATQPLRIKAIPEFIEDSSG